MKKLYKLLLICLLTIAGGGNALKAQSYNSDNSETANRAETPTYISKIAVAYGAEASTPKDILKNNGFTIIDKDLNAGCGSNTHYIYMGYKTTTNPADAITGIYIREGNDTPNSATFDGVTAYLLGGSTEDNPGENKPVDLNIDAGGATLHVYVSRNTNLAAITDIKFSNTNSMSGYVTQNIDLNKGASGEYIYLHYKQYSAQVYANLHYINESCQSVSKKFYGTLLHHLDDVEITPSIPTLLTYDDRSLAFMCWKDNTEAMMDYEYISKININLESSGMTFYGLYYFSPQTPLNLRFDANGGTGAPEDQKTDIFGLRYLNAGNGTPVYELSTFQIPNNICTKVGTCKFLGWSTDPNANSAEYQPGQSIDIALNTTLYAIYDSAHEYENGFCSICGAYEPAELVNGYYQIKTADNLFWFAEYINHIDRTASAKLMNDIDLEGRPWTPIGTTGESSHNFRGHFDGNGKTITGLNVEVTRNGGGFFGEVRLGTVEDFTIYGEVKLNGNHSYVGGVIGSAPGANSNQPEHNGATIRNITSYVNVTLGEGSHGSNHVAGFIGYANHETLIENCTWYGTLDLDAYRAQDGVGGLVGKANDNSEITIRNCAAYGTIKTNYQSGSYNSHNSIYIGGIVSNSVENAQTTLENCIWAGTLINNTNLGDNAHISAIGTLNGIKSVSNCYALNNMPYITTNDAHNEGITEVTAGQLASGEIAYKLQGTQATQIWGQNIDNGETADSKPILGGAKVYGVIYDGGGIYSNTNITAGGKCGDNLYWKVSDNTLTIFGTGAMNNYDNSNNKAPWRNLETPPTSLVMEDGITHIGNFAFRNCSGFDGSLTIPNSVTTIGNSAFRECSGFTGSLTIPNSVTTIGNYAFGYCSGFTGSLTIGNSVTTIGDYAFYECLGFNGSLTIPNSVTSIGERAFYKCSSFNGSLTIPNSVTSIGESAFYNCSSFTGSLTIPNSVTTIGNYAFNGCSGFTGDLTIPNSVTTIGNYAFSGCSGFTGSLTIPNSVTTIGNYAFGYCSGFTGSLTIPNSVTSIGESAFYICEGFTGDLTIGNSVTTIGMYAFYKCSGFTEVYSLAKTAPTLQIRAFTGTNSNATLYYPVSSEQSYNNKGWFNYFSKRIGFNGKCGDNLFWYVNDDNILTIFGTGAMYDYSYYGIDNLAPWCSLNPAPTSLVLEEGITTIGNSAFYGCSGFTGSLTIPNSVTSIGEYAFTNCSGFTGSLTIPNSVTTIGNYAFRYCSGFTGSLTIGNSVTSIGEYAFANCYGFTGSLTIPNNVTSIGECAFTNCYGFTGSLTIPNSVTTIGNYAFSGCYGFTGSLTIPNSVTSIGEYAFADCRGFTGSLTIPNSVTSIGEYAFQYCSGFNGSLTIPNSVTSIGNEAFYDCEGFKEVYSFAETAPTLGTNAFANINENATLYFPASSEQSYDENGWFNYFSKRIGINGICGDYLYWKVSDNVLTIFGTGAMYDYDNIDNKAPWHSLNPAPTSLVLEEGVSHIGDYAFYECSSFTEVYSLAETAPALGTDAFKNINENATLYYPASSEQSYDENGWFNYFPQHIGFDGKCGDNLYWYVDDTNTLTIFGTGAMYDYSSIGSSIGNNTPPWRSLNPAPISLVLEDGITHIGNSAFSGCSSFTGSLTIPNSVTSIGEYAFANCSGFTGSLTIPNSITNIEVGAFGACSGFTGSLTIPNSVTTIGDNAFVGCYSFTGSLTIPNSVTTIGDNAFYICSGFTGDLTIPNSVTTIGDNAFHNCSGFTGDLTIPNSVTTIGDNAFYNCIGFSKVHSFAEVAPTLGTNAFTSANSNATLYYPASSEQSYDDKGWFNYFLKRIGYDNNKKCGDNLYWNVDDTNTLTIFGTGAMYDYSYYGSIDNQAPWRSLNTAPTSLVLEEGITHIGNYAFYGCSGFTGSLTIPNSVTTIGNNAFYQCSGFDGSLTIGNSVTTIGDWAFYQCSGFTGDLTIPNSVTSIGEYAFLSCSNFTGSLTIGNSVTSIGNSAFYDCEGFTGSLTIGNSVTSIGNSAFYDCEGFTGSLTIGNSVTTIGDWAFYNCSGFKGSLTIPNSVTYIGNYAFYQCSGFDGSLTIGNSVTSIGSWAFADCRGFTGSLTIPNSVKSIGNEAFFNCSGFNGSLTIPNSVTTIGESAFEICSGFNGSLTIPNSVTSIGNYAFAYCYGFTGSLTIPNSVTTIGESAFEICSGFTDIFFYRDTNPTIGTSAFSYINANAKVYAPVIWSSFDNIPEDKLVKMATFVGQQTTDASTGSATINGWIGLAEGQTWPDEDDHVAINASLVLGQQTTDNGQQSSSTEDNGQQTTDNRLWVKSFGYCGDGTTVNGSITIEDGGQLYCEIANGEVTVKKEIVGYAETTRQQDNETTSETVWYTIASPLKDTLLISDPQFLNSSVPQFLSSNSDLYRYDEPTYTWQNAKNSANNGFNTIDPGRGYLYANAENTSLEFTGNINTETVTYNLTAKSNVLKGFHLIGNPFTHNITFAHLNATEGAELVNGYYVLNGEGAWGATLGSNEDDVIKVGQGVLVKAKTEGTLAISRQPSAVSRQRSGKGQQTTDNGQQSLCISVSNAKYSDRAFVVFDKGVGLDKMNHENENIPLLYIPMEDADYAIAMMDMNVNEIPVNFETNVMGQYTISLRQENCEFEELYLLDKETNTTVNILEQDYTFIATSSDNPERFVLIKDNRQKTKDNRPWVYVNNGDIVIYDIEGDADIKIFDALGRCVYQGESSDETTRIANGYSSGVYMIQKVDDKGVNVQKIIL